MESLTPNPLNDVIGVSVVGAGIGMIGLEGTIGNLIESILSTFVPSQELVQALTFGFVCGGIYGIYHVFLKEKIDKYF